MMSMLKYILHVYDQNIYYKSKLKLFVEIIDKLIITF